MPDDRITFGSAEAGDGAITIGSGHEATGIRPRTGTEMIIETGTVTGATAFAPSAMRAFLAGSTGSMVEGSR